MYKPIFEEIFKESNAKVKKLIENAKQMKKEIRKCK